MVRCRKYTGESCKCQLIDDECQRFLMRFFLLMVKVVTNCATDEEKDEMNFIGSLHFKYLELFVRHSDLLIIKDKQD